MAVDLAARAADLTVVDGVAAQAVDSDLADWAAEEAAVAQGG
jgi:hypothetical protein